MCCAYYNKLYHTVHNLEIATCLHQKIIKAKREATTMILVREKGLSMKSATISSVGDLGSGCFLHCTVSSQIRECYSVWRYKVSVTKPTFFFSCPSSSPYGSKKKLYQILGSRASMPTSSRFCNLTFQIRAQSLHSCMQGINTGHEGSGVQVPGSTFDVATDFFCAG